MNIFKKIRRSISGENINRSKRKRFRRLSSNEENETDTDTVSDSIVIDIDNVISTLLKGKQNTNKLLYVNLQEEDISGLCYMSSEIFLKQPPLLELSPPINVFGDIHGQYQDLLRWFDIVGYPPDANFLFLGDYVDRGDQSIETICLLMAYKIKYPDIFFMLRGNHECSTLNLVYGFYEDCVKRYNKKVWKMFTDVFNCLPVAALVEDKIFCCHGGISPLLSDLDQLKKIERPIEVPQQGIVCDLLWADPDPYVSGFQDSERGVSYSFGREALREFLRRLNLDLVCRAHQVVEDGYELLFNRRIVTIFSAPNYCGEFDNAGGMMAIDENLVCTFQILKPRLNLINSKVNDTNPTTTSSFT